MNKNQYLDQFCVEKKTSILQSLKKINSNEKGFLVIIEDEIPVAVLTDGDLRRAIIGGTDLDQNIEKIISKDFNFIKGESDFYNIADIFATNPINFIPITDSSNKLVDIVTKDQFEASVLLDKPLSLNSRLEGQSIEDLYHQIIPKPWGYYKTTLLTSDYQSKILCINPGQSISLQSHNHREEHWVNVKGCGQVIIGESVKKFESGDYAFIPKGCKHRIINSSEDDKLIVNEVQLGTNFDEEDIIRYEDNYGR